MKIEIRADCKVCGGDIVYNRFRTFCSEKCRIQHNNEGQKEYQKEWLRAKRKKLKALQDIETGVITENKTEDSLTQVQEGV